MDSSLTDVEKRFVLAEMIKVSQIDIGALVEFVKHYDVQPDWFSMQLPNGRNMNQCIRATQSLGIPYPQPPILPNKRKSLGDLNEPLPKRPAIAPIEPQPMNYRNVNIQPRPSPNGYQAVHPIASPTVPQASIGKKRGRPSKADKEAQARANASGSFPHVLAPAPPLAPHPAGPPPQDYSPNTPASYHVSSGPVDPKTKKRGQATSTTDKSQPRGLPEISPDTAERSPALSNLISTPTPENHVPKENPAVHEAGRKLSGTVPTAVMDPVRKDLQPPVTPVNTTA